MERTKTIRHSSNSSLFDLSSQTQSARSYREPGSAGGFKWTGSSLESKTMQRSRIPVSFSLALSNALTVGTQSVKNEQVMMTETDTFFGISFHPYK